MKMSANHTNGRVHKLLRKRKFNKNEVLRVFAAVMEKQATNSGSVDDKNSHYHNEFFTTGRIGRRNALPDILGYNSTTSTADLPARLSTLTTKDVCNDNTTASTAGTINLDRNEPSTSQSCSNSTAQPQIQDMNAT